MPSRVELQSLGYKPIHTYARQSFSVEESSTVLQQPFGRDSGISKI